MAVHLKYLGNADVFSAQMSKVYSHNGEDISLDSPKI